MAEKRFPVVIAAVITSGLLRVVMLNLRQWILMWEGEFHSEPSMNEAGDPGGHVTHSVTPFA